MRTSMKAPLTASTSPGSSSPRSVARYWLRLDGAPAFRPTPAKWASAPSGVGKERLQAWSNSPEGVISLQPTIPIRGSDASLPRQASTAPAVISVSGLSRSTDSAAVSSRTRLLAAEKPMFERRTSRTPGNSAATISGVESGLPLSTTVTRWLTEGGLASIELRHRRSRSFAPWLTITTSNSGEPIVVLSTRRRRGSSPAACAGGSPGRR